MTMSIGFIGVGTLAAAMIDGLSCGDTAPFIWPEALRALGRRQGSPISCQDRRTKRPWIAQTSSCAPGNRTRLPPASAFPSLAAGVSLRILRLIVGTDVALARVLLLTYPRIGKSPTLLPADGAG